MDRSLYCQPRTRSTQVVSCGSGYFESIIHFYWKLQSERGSERKREREKPSSSSPLLALNGRVLVFYSLQKWKRSRKPITCTMEILNAHNLQWAFTMETPPFLRGCLIRALHVNPSTPNNRSTCRRRRNDERQYHCARKRSTTTTMRTTETA